MTRMTMYSFRAFETDALRWKAEAKEAGLSFGEWARQRLNGPLLLPKLASVVTKPPEPEPKKSSRCEHRLPKGSYCKTCERIKL